MTFSSLAEIIRKNEYFLTRDVVREIRQTPGIRHYRNTADNSLYDRVNRVLYHIYKRLPHWLRHGVSKHTLFSLYSEVGRQRHREGIPLEELIQVLFLIRRRVFRCISEQCALGRGDHSVPAREFLADVNLLFNHIARAIISGYLECTSTRKKSVKKQRA
ncbi:MAG: hypothetical protein ACOX3E_05535 [Desulfomonilia bacterium]|jgi:hypothetical protein|uniref:RsbT co-antagonist protein RsbRD N-terminal domain-containing protein n=1 Tax=anaerobic digester metagenome TaxID=1263854 RepID=A0A485LYD4_9ZZZZ|nr:hypothetical protein [Pseudomonadota bacterium]HON37599.1 hypothetical protein [Deltaproteobacteria bacterium]HRS55106.1 hypothetical protein [Desulfomonilia bacterium]HPD21457.1 hypothetical protein [Deltaproteobacteria bacterium]HPX51705.1 hypothetical protein [Deltaproteobacteria bacterium]